MIAEKKYVLGIDFGTQGLKLGIFSALGKLVWKGEQSYPTYFPQVGRAEQNPLDWWNALIRLLHQGSANVDLSRIGGICVCATSSSVLLVDPEGTPVMPAMMWMDQRAVPDAGAINENRDPAVTGTLRYSGGKVSEEWMTPKALWLKRNGMLKPGYKVVEQLDWINYMLTGKWAASQCNAVCKWNYVPSEGGFSPSFFSAIGWPEFAEHWPQEVIPVGGLVGTVTSQAAGQLGLPEGVPVFQGGIDAHIGMLGVGAVDPGVMALVMGTSFVHLVHSPKPVFQQGLWGPYPDALLPGSWLLEGGQLTCGSLTTWFLKQFYPDVPEEKRAGVYGELLREAEKIPAGSEGIVIMDSWQGNRTPYRNPLATGAIVGLTLAHTRYHIFRAILEATAYGTKNVIEAFQQTEQPIKRIIACGGGTKNPLWMQILSDVTGLAIETLEETEAGIKGCAITAAYGLGYYPSLADAAKAMGEKGKAYEPRPEERSAYEKYFQIYLRLHETLFPVMKELIVT
jgi:FGGY-family pentulose kinase